MTLGAGGLPCMTPNALTSFIADVDGLADGPHAIGERLAGQSTPIHDHVSWCVVGVYEGRERETRFRTVGRRLEEAGSIDALPGHVR